MDHDRESSEKMASQAGHLLRCGNPLNDDRFVDAIIHNVRDTIANGTQEDARAAIREPLNQFCNTAVELAGSVVSQARGSGK